MHKHLLTILIFFALNKCLFSQILYSNSFSNLSLQSYSNINSVTLNTTVPSEFTLINDAYTNNTGSINNPNAPFQVPVLNSAGWAVVYNPVVNDTFLVSTSWLTNTTTTADRWLISNTITNISANTVLTWLAMSPDAAYPDGYEVYVTNKTGILTAADFSLIDTVFTIPDGHTAGGGEKNIWTRRSASLKSFAGQIIRFAFRNKSKNMFQIWIDDIEIKTLPKWLDLEATALITEKYVLINTSDTVRINVTNRGAESVSTAVLNYQYGTSSANTQTFTFANKLKPLQNNTLLFNLPFSISSQGYYPLKCWINSVNGIGDDYNLNDTAKFFITVQSVSPHKNVMVEQFVSASDAESVDAQEKLRQFAYAANTIVTVNIHDGDSLFEANSFAVINTYRKNYSTALIDRVYFDGITNTVKRPNYASRIDKRLKAVTPVSVSIINKTFNTLTRLLSFTVKADFLGEVKGDYRLNAYLTENNVYGKANDSTINGYNQLSNYFNVPISPYYQMGYYSALNNAWVLDAWHYKHQQVLIHSFNGSFGTAGVIPSGGGTQGQSFQQTFTLTIPTSSNGVYKFNPDNIYIVGFAAEYNSDINQRNILNVVKEKLNSNYEVVGISENNIGASVAFYPNPTEGKVFLHIDDKNTIDGVRIYDVLGNCLIQNHNNNKENNFELQLSELTNGVYFLVFNYKETVRVQKIILQKK